MSNGSDFLPIRDWEFHRSGPEGVCLRRHKIANKRHTDSVIVERVDAIPIIIIIPIAILENSALGGPIEAGISGGSKLDKAFARTMVPKPSFTAPEASMIEQCCRVSVI